MGDTATMSGTARAGTQDAPARRRAVGTRDRIVGHLTMIREIADPAGMASARLAQAVGYPGSSVAFAQLLSSMERDGLITREVRGKRTYRIALSAPVPVRPRPEPAAPPVFPADGDRAAFPSAIDYDELARRVVVHLVRRLSELSAAELDMLERLLAPPAGSPSTATA